MPVARLVSELRVANRELPPDESSSSAARQKLFVVNSSEFLIVPRWAIVVPSLCRVQITKWLVDWIRKLSYLCNFCRASNPRGFQRHVNFSRLPLQLHFNFCQLFNLISPPSCRVTWERSFSWASCARPLVCRLWIIQDVSGLIRSVYHYDTLRCFKIFLSVLCSLFWSATSVATSYLSSPFYNAVSRIFLSE